MNMLIGAWIAATLLLSNSCNGFVANNQPYNGSTLSSATSSHAVAFGLSNSLYPFKPSERHTLYLASSDDTSTETVSNSAEVPEKDTTAPKKKKKTPPPVQPVEIDVSKLDIRVGVITKCWEHEEADKLFCEEIDIGEDEPRTIASGLKAHYKAEDLQGQRVLVLANLKQRKMVGFPSHGMVLCAVNEDASVVEFVEPPADAKIGERVMVEGFDGEPASENQIIKKKMLDKIFPDLKTNSDGVATYQDKPLSTEAGPCISQTKLANAEIS